MINYLPDVLIIIFSFTIFGALHSFLASNYFKDLLVKKFGNLIAFYRLAYNLFAVVTFYLFYSFIPKPGVEIYDLPTPYDIIILVPQFLALGGFFWTLNSFCVKEFLGLTQIKRWINNEYDLNEKDEHLTLRIGGAYRYSRHPMYFFIIMFLLLRPQMNLFYLTTVLSFIAYFYIGSYFEEKKLIERFGDEYRNYKKSVSRILPVNLFNPYHKNEGSNND